MLGVDNSPFRRHVGFKIEPANELLFRPFSKPFWENPSLNGCSKPYVARKEISTARTTEDLPRSATDSKLADRNTANLRKHTGNLRSCLLVPKGDGTNEKVAIQKSKSVHFADSCGMSLTSVLTLFDGEDDYPSIRACFSTPTLSYPCLETVQQRASAESKQKYKLVNFRQPVASPYFQERVKRNNVSLENITFRNGCLFGTAVVKNLDFSKNVFVRYTMDDWVTCNDLNAVYLSGSCTGSLDTFSFEIVLPKQHEGNINIELTLCYEVLGENFWDNNNGENFKVVCLPNIDIYSSYTKKNFLLDMAENRSCRWIL